MAIGPAIRRLFGRHEHRLASLYRAIYTDIDAVVEQVLVWHPCAMRILEVGCGEGAVTELLRAAYPDAEITGIDLSPNVGRLYRGHRDKVWFKQWSVQQIAASYPGCYDLVVLSDVLHHVPIEHRSGLLDAIRATIAPSGQLIFKDWVRNYTPIYWLGYVSDRWISGDRISYMTVKEMDEILGKYFGTKNIVAHVRLRPWRTNIAILVRT